MLSGWSLASKAVDFSPKIPSSTLMSTKEMRIPTARMRRYGCVYGDRAGAWREEYGGWGC
ncbi:hypothetical protein V6Z11_A04G171000 [Gossypium hirsutum]